MSTSARMALALLILTATVAALGYANANKKAAKTAAYEEAATRYEQYLDHRIATLDERMGTLQQMQAMTQDMEKQLATLRETVANGQSPDIENLTQQAVELQQKTNMLHQQALDAPSRDKDAR